VRVDSNDQAEKITERLNQVFLVGGFNGELELLNDQVIECSGRRWLDFYFTCDGLETHGMTLNHLVWQTAKKSAESKIVDSLSDYIDSIFMYPAFKEEYTTIKKHFIKNKFSAPISCKP